MDAPGTWLLDAKRTPPQLAADRVQRDFSALPVPLPSFVGLVGGPGAGKTLALAELYAGLVRAAADAPPKPALWYALDEEDADMAGFFVRLVEGLRQHVPVAGEPVLAMVRDGRLAPKALWQAFFGDVAAYGLPAFALALDDAHHQPEAIGPLAELAERFPPGFHVLAASRKPLNIGKQVAAGRAVLVDEGLLRFGPEEVEAFLRARAKGGPVPPAWRDRAPELEGWPLGLALVTAAGPEGAAVPGAGSAALESYVADVLYNSQPAERQAFMLRLALLPVLDADTAATVLAEPRAGALLAGLHADHLLRKLEPAGYAFPSHLRSFLRAEATRSLSPVALAALHRRIAGHLVDLGRPGLALPHHVAAGDWAEALAAATDAFPAMRHDGRHAEIAKHLAAFPPAQRETEPLLLIWDAHLHARAGRLAEAADAYDKARQAYRDRGDAKGEIAALVRQIGAAASAGDLPRFNRLSVQAAARAFDARPEDLAELQLARALVADRRGDQQLARECNQAVLALPLGTSLELAAAHVTARLNLAQALINTGDLDEALREAGHARETAAMRGLAAPAAYAAFVEARALLARGEIGPAGRAIAGVPMEWPELLDWQAGAQAYVVLGQLRGAEEAWDEAEAAIRTASARFEAAGRPEGRKLGLEALAWLALRRRQYARVEGLVADAARPADQEVWNGYDLALTLPQARALHLAGDPIGAAALLDAARPGFARLGMKLAQARLALYEAAAKLESGEPKGAAVAFAAAEELRQGGGFDFLPAIDPALWRALAPLRGPKDGGQAAPATPEPAPAPPSGLIGGPRRGTGPLSAPIAPPRPGQVPPVAPGAVPGRTSTGPVIPPRTGPVIPPPPGAAKPAAAAVAAPPAAPAGRLTIQCFGRFEVRLDGVVLDKWPRRKAKVALAALALRNGPVPSFSLGELLGDGDAVSGHGILKVTMPALRRALEPELQSGGASAFIKTLDDGYQMVEGVVGACDVRVFEQALSRGRQLKASAPPEAAAAYEQALSVYTGELFSEPLFAAAFEAERDGYKRQALDAAFWLADNAGSIGDATGRGQWLARAVQIAPSDEEVYVRLMQHHRAVGRPDRVRQAYWDCRKALKRELEIEPSEAFETAYRELS